MNLTSLLAPMMRVLLAALFSRLIALGYFTPQGATEMTKWIMDAVAFLVPALIGAYTLHKSTAASRIATVNNLPSVEAIIVNDKDISDKVPGVTLRASSLVTFMALLVVAGSLMGCMTTVASLDARLRDKCNYLQSAVTIAQLGASFYPGANVLVSQGASLVSAYCYGAPITDPVSALNKMEDIIVAVRPIAAKVQK